MPCDIKVMTNITYTASMYTLVPIIPGVCVCVRERGKERVCAQVYMCKRDLENRGVCVCVKERESE